MLKFRATNTFGHSFVYFFEFLHCKYLNIFKYSNIYRQTYSFGKYSLDFEATNIFGYSFVKEKLHLLHAGPRRIGLSNLFTDRPHSGAAREVYWRWGLLTGGGEYFLKKLCYFFLRKNLLFSIDPFSNHWTIEALIAKFIRQQVSLSVSLQ